MIMGRKGVTITIRKTKGRWGGKVTIMIKGRKGVIITIRKTEGRPGLGG